MACPVTQCSITSWIVQFRYLLNSKHYRLDSCCSYVEAEYHPMNAVNWELTLLKVFLPEFSIGHDKLKMIRSDIEFTLHISFYLVFNK